MFVVDAIRMRNEAEYREKARKELWRHLEGDILNADIIAAEEQLRQSLVDEPVCVCVCVCVCVHIYTNIYIYMHTHKHVDKTRNAMLC